jgi:hypothetical protein
MRHSTDDIKGQGLEITLHDEQVNTKRFIQGWSLLRKQKQHKKVFPAITLEKKHKENS